MERGILTGLVSGTAVALVVAGGVSVVVGLPERLKAVSAPEPIVQEALEETNPTNADPIDEPDVSLQADSQIAAEDVPKLETPDQASGSIDNMGEVTSAPEPTIEEPVSVAGLPSPDSLDNPIMASGAEGLVSSSDLPDLTEPAQRRETPPDITGLTSAPIPAVEDVASASPILTSDTATADPVISSEALAPRVATGVPGLETPSGSSGDIPDYEGQATAPIPDVASASPDVLPILAPQAESGLTVDADTPVVSKPMGQAATPPSVEDAIVAQTMPADPPEPKILPAAEAPQVALLDVAPNGTRIDPAPSVSKENPAPKGALTPTSPEANTPDAPAIESLPAESAPVPVVRRLIDEEKGEGPSIGVRVGTLTDRANAGASSRLPLIGETLENESDVVEEQVDLPPVKQFAVKIDVDADRPRMAIVLLHNADVAIGPEAIESFPFPVSIAVDTTLPDARDVMTQYRDKGFEVLALTNIPKSAQPSDVEVSLQAALSAVPEAVALIEGLGDGIQGSRGISDQVTDIIKDAGYGLIMQPNGLNTAQALAAKEGIPSAVVFRDFDGAGQNMRSIRRFLDQAAFRARQSENGVIMIGRMKPDTISSLLIWGLADRASKIALVPVTMTLSSAQ